MFERLLQRIANVLDRHHIPYMVIGGQAVLVYGRVRVTRDIDITLGIGTEKLADMLSICGELGLTVLSEKPDEFAQDTMVLPAEDPKSRIRVDFIFSFTPYETAALKRAEAIKMGDSLIRFASREDVIVHKMAAGRAVDVEDIKSILDKSGKALDFNYIRQWLSEITQIPGCEGIVQRFDELLKSKKKDQ
jgi:predicted nucleotidyltransferase